ncbi:MAG: STAS domain-containing protein [Chromatiales bacterium]|jgi:phospholipid transport system transporter-binding protein|nr:STAS domain-containing protein [Chromatiales bacterium]
MAELRVAGSGECTVHGEMVFGTVSDLLAQGRAIFSAGSPALKIDLRDIARVDSAGLVLLLEWFKTARRGGQDIVFVNVPAQVFAMAGISNLDQVLPLRRGAMTGSFGHAPAAE